MLNARVFGVKFTCHLGWLPKSLVVGTIPSPLTQPCWKYFDHIYWSPDPFLATVNATGFGLQYLPLEDAILPNRVALTMERNESGSRTKIPQLPIPLSCHMFILICQYLGSFQWLLWWVRLCINIRFCFFWWHFWKNHTNEYLNFQDTA